MLTIFWSSTHNTIGRFMKYFKMSFLTHQAWNQLIAIVICVDHLTLIPKCNYNSYSYCPSHDCQIYLGANTYHKYHRFSNIKLVKSISATPRDNYHGILKLIILIQQVYINQKSIYYHEFVYWKPSSNLRAVGSRVIAVGFMV